MASPHFLEEKPLSLVDVKHILEKTESRDTQLNHLSGKVTSLSLTRLKEEHYCKIIDFLPQNQEELKVILQSYPLSLSKKDQESIVQVIQDTFK